MAGEWIALSQNAMIRQSALAVADHFDCSDAPLRAYFPLGRSLLGAGRNLRDRLQDLRSDLVGVALRVRAAVFQIALVAVVGEGMRHADRSAAVGNAVAELVPGRGLVLAGQALVVVRTVDRD